MCKDREIRPEARITPAAMLMALVVLLAMMAPSARADAWRGNNAARVDATIRPCFGMLLDAQLRTCGPQRHYRYDGGRYGYYGHGRADATVDCDRASQGYVEAVARNIRPYGVLYLKAHNRSCVASLDIDHSITIVGQGFGPNTIPVLVAPDGQNCLRISPNADKVILKNVYVSSPRGGNAPCIEAAGKELTIQNSEIRYQGDNAAVHVAGGRLNLTDSSHIIAKTRAVALAVSEGELYAENSEIASTAGGIYAVLTGDSQILGVSVQQLADWHGFERGDNAIGLDLKLDSADSILTMNDMKVQYFAEGIHLDGAGEALLSHSLVARSDHAVTSSVSRVRIIENTLIANEIGIDVEAGTADVGRNQIANVRTAGILAQSNGEIRAVDNAIDPNGEGCPTLRWGNIDPAERTCRPWFKGSAFDVPGDAADQVMFDQFWPHMSADTYNASPDQLAKPDVNRP
ncbi:right-handed parallel beta-helix repeat-containing protein [Asticcacaulis sp. EMRT-3]|uniref:right-handed parallel beta-helix repeat-containing protein n=1 Tax=Asticcacaulis sp. EMRT-3 TaxID=3040349 RepID=UPI0024AFEE7B|nr:right-handed parallel beta-helix repeat-containing protein [Asticcacaulis sp. EMRT-3]MDI7776310.1 right-handed parallel beta-helix repeat-containing protein [Asticcacaulis sp. EMRT-3]